MDFDNLSITPDEDTWTPSTSSLPELEIHSKSGYEVQTKWKIRTPMLKILPVDKNRLHVKNLEFQTRLKKLRIPCHIEAERREIFFLCLSETSEKKDYTSIILRSTF